MQDDRPTRIATVVEGQFQQRKTPENTAFSRVLAWCGKQDLNSKNCMTHRYFEYHPVPKSQAIQGFSLSLVIPRIFV